MCDSRRMSLNYSRIWNLVHPLTRNTQGNRPLFSNSSISFYSFLFRFVFVFVFLIEEVFFQYLKSKCHFSKALLLCHFLRTVFKNWNLQLCFYLVNNGYFLSSFSVYLWAFSGTTGYFVWKFPTLISGLKQCLSCNLVQSVPEYFCLLFDMCSFFVDWVHAHMIFVWRNEKYCCRYGQDKEQKLIQNCN